jgi:hypothetical protein
MNASKFSMPRRPVCGSRRSSGSGKGSHERICAEENAERGFLRKQVVGNTHLVAVGVGAERQQRRVLGLPSKSSHAALSRGDIDDDRGAAADAIAIAIDGILQRQQCLVWDSLRRDRRRTRESERASRSR